MRTKLYTIVVALFFTGFLSVADAQIMSTEYFLSFPQSSLSNPAFRPDNKTTVGIPILSNFYLGLNNNMFKISDLFATIPSTTPGSDSTISFINPDFDRGRVLDKLGKTGYFSTDLSMQILNVGFTLNDDWYVDLSLSQKTYGSVYLPRDLFTIIFEGNKGFVGSSMDFSGLGIEMIQYLETSVNISKDINDRLRIGARGKLLFGGAALSLKNKRLEIEIDDDYTHTLYGDVTLSSSGPIEIIAEDIASSLEMNVMDFSIDNIFNFSNPGVAFDLGAEYQLLDNLTLSASILDLGFISWSEEISGKNIAGSFAFDGAEISIDDGSGFGVDFESIGDSIDNSFVVSDAGDRFKTGLPAKFLIGAQYRPLPYLGAGLMYRATINQGYMSQALSLSGTFYAGDILSTSLVYSMANRNYSNLGWGFTVRMGPIQLYTIFDQIPLSWTEFTSESEFGESTIIIPPFIRYEPEPDTESGVASFKAPDRLNYFSFRMGINLVFGKVKQKANDKPMLLE